LLIFIYCLWHLVTPCPVSSWSTLWHLVPLDHGRPCDTLWHLVTPCPVRSWSTLWHLVTPCPDSSWSTLTNVQWVDHDPLNVGQNESTSVKWINFLNKYYFFLRLFSPRVLNIYTGIKKWWRHRPTFSNHLLLANSSVFFTLRNSLIYSTVYPPPL